jgi:hypothetical protein
MQHIGHDSQRAAAPRANSGLVFLELDPSLPDRRRGELDTGTGEPGGDSDGRSASTRPQPTMKWSPVIQNGTATLSPADAVNCARLDASFRRRTSSPFGKTRVARK